MTRPTFRPPRRPAAAAIELAMVLPLLALLTAMVVDFARVLHATQVLDAAAADAAATSAGNASNPAAPDAVWAAAATAGADLAPPLRPDQVTVVTSGGTTTVAVVYDHPLILAALFPAGTVQLQRTATRTVMPRAGD